MSESRSPRITAITTARARRAAALATLLLVAVGFAWGQAPVEMRVNTRVNPGVRMNRAAGANPMLGARGINYARPMSPLIGANSIASGTASYGLSLRSMSPIGDPTAFRGSLGSNSLYAFRRDSVSVAGSPLGSGTLGRPFYDPSSTVPTVGFLKELAAPPRLPIGSGPVSQRISTPGALSAQILGLAPPASAPNMQGPPASPASLATSSSIFAPQTPQLLLPEPVAPWSGKLSEEFVNRARQAVSPQRLDLLKDMRLVKPEEILAKPLETIMRPELSPSIGMISPTGEVQRFTGRLGLILPEPTEAAEPEPAAGQQQMVDPSVLPGFDVFTDMQLAVQLLSDPNAKWFAEMQQAIRERPELADKVDQQMARDAAEFIERAVHTPMTTMVGVGASAVNEQMREAEALMDVGRYAEAANRYSAAHHLDPRNPLPLLGKGHALLAAGLYESAAHSLLQGIELVDVTPGLAQALLRRLDLTALMGGGEIIDIRRARMMQRLEARENPALRFLLGYLEYHTGDHARGLEDLRRAAEDPRAGATIGRYPALLGHPSQPRPDAGAGQE